MAYAATSSTRLVELEGYRPAGELEGLRAAPEAAAAAAAPLGCVGAAGTLAERWRAPPGAGDAPR